MAPPGTMMQPGAGLPGMLQPGMAPGMLQPGMLQGMQGMPGVLPGGMAQMGGQQQLMQPNSMHGLR